MKDLSNISVRIVGLALVVYALAWLPSQHYIYTLRPESEYLLFIIPSLIPAIAGFIMLYFPITIGRKIEQSIPDTIKIDDPSAILNIGCILIGLLLLFYSISDLVFHLSTMAILGYSPQAELSELTFDYPSLIATIFELMFALLLVLKSKIIIRTLSNRI